VVADIALRRCEYAGNFNIVPKTVHGMLWLQIHFEDHFWGALSDGTAYIGMSDMGDMFADASEADVTISVC
jgi:hypothetical protein